ncbi:MAG: helix-turn-helix transcriptional regulator [Blastocatellia bacterium]|nr:helix-turn-helix transcriptional regulator [Blastocatellia bacterium]
MNAEKVINLGEACIEEALKIVAEQGIEQLSLRDIARRLGVSHQAPYKHYANREHLLAEIVKRCFADFSNHLDSRPESCHPMEDLGNLGHAYLTYALTKPLQYSLMFGSSLPDPGKYPEMMKQARHAFSILKDAITRLDDKKNISEIEINALFVWSTMHGMAGILQNHVAGQLNLSVDLKTVAIPKALDRIRIALEAQIANLA